MAHGHIIGVRRLFIVNTLVTNAAPLRCALELLRAQNEVLMVSVINTATMSERVRRAQFADAADWHVNDAETSLRLAIAPEMVRQSEMVGTDDPDRTEGLVFSDPVNRTSLNGVTGKPSIATAEKGREFFNWMREDLSEIVRCGLLETAPLAYRYQNQIS